MNTLQGHKVGDVFRHRHQFAVYRATNFMRAGWIIPAVEGITDDGRKITARLEEVEFITGDDLAEILETAHLDRHRAV